MKYILSVLLVVVILIGLRQHSMIVNLEQELEVVQSSDAYQKQRNKDLCLRMTEQIERLQMLFDLDRAKYKPTVNPETTEQILKRAFATLDRTKLLVEEINAREEANDVNRDID